VRRFVYKIEPVSLIPGDAEYIFESEEETQAWGRSSSEQVVV
jgi:hypothetical protein